MNMQDPRLGARIEAEGTRINTEIRNPGRGRRGTSVISQLIKLAVLAAIIAAFFYWVYS